MIKKLLSFVKEYKKASILSPVFVMLEVVMEVAIPVVMAGLIDSGIEKGDMGYILKSGSVLFIMSVFSLIFGALAGKNAAYASSGFAKNLRKEMFYNIQTFSFKNIDKFSTSSLITRLTTDVNHVQHAYQMIIRGAVRSPIMMSFSLVVALSLCPALGLVFLCAVPILAFGLIYISKTAHPIFEKVFKTYDGLNQVVGENLSGIRVVKLFNREEYEKNKFNNISYKIYDLFKKAEQLIALNMPLMQFTMYMCTLIISYMGAKLVVMSGNNPDLGLSTGELTSFIAYTTQILMSLMMISMTLVMLTISRASAERIIEVIDEESSILGKEDGIKEVKNGDIKFNNVSFSYLDDENKLCLTDINIDIKSGETVGILGGTGSGKTSLVSLIPRLYDVFSGSVEVGGYNVKDYDLDTLRNSVAMVLQKNTLFSGTISENLRWGNEFATDEELINAAKLSCAHDFISDFPDGYNTYIEQGGTNVSGGQKQRLCIARALLKSPKIIILDDSTSAVDMGTDAKIRKAFKEKIPSITKIIIAQRVSSVQDADKIIVIDDGKIAATGTHKELLLSCEIYKEVYESQKKGGDEDE